MGQRLSERPPEWPFARQENTRLLSQEAYTWTSYRYCKTTLSPLGSELKPSGTTKKLGVRTLTIFSRSLIMRQRRSTVKCLHFLERWTLKLSECLRYVMRRELSRSLGSIRFHLAD